MFFCKLVLNNIIFEFVVEFEKIKVKKGLKVRVITTVDRKTQNKKIYK